MSGRTIVACLLLAATPLLAGDVRAESAGAEGSTLTKVLSQPVGDFTLRWSLGINGQRDMREAFLRNDVFASFGGAYRAGDRSVALMYTYTRPLAADSAPVAEWIVMIDRGTGKDWRRVDVQLRKGLGVAGADWDARVHMTRRF
jgi:hypothetical protein